jgi:hypothetical protein
MGRNEWVRQFVKELRLLRPHLTEEMLEVIAGAFCSDRDPKLAARGYHQGIKEAGSLRSVASFPLSTAAGRMHSIIPGDTVEGALASVPADTSDCATVTR